MGLPKRIYSVLVWTVLVCLAGQPAMGSNLEQQNLKIAIKQKPVPAPPEAVLVAENNSDAKEGEPAGSAQSEEPGQNPEAPKTGDGPAAKREAEPIKPFVPSEEVKAEQAVDFPYDI